MINRNESRSKNIQFLMDYVKNQYGSKDNRFVKIIGSLLQVYRGYLFGTFPKKTWTMSLLLLILIVKCGHRFSRWT